MFEASKRSLAEARCVDMVNVGLNVLEIGAVLLLARSRKIQVGIDSCAGVTVFVHLRCFETKSCKPCMDLSARKVKGKFRGVPFWYACLKMAETCEVLAALVAVSESDMSHDGFFPLLRRRYPSVCVPGGTWRETGTGVKRGLRSASHETADRSSNSPTARLSGLPSTMSDVDSVLSKRCAVLRTSGISDFLNSQSRSSFPRSVSGPKVMSSSLNCRSFLSSEHREELQCHVEEDAAEKRVTKIVKILLAEVCPYRAIDRGKSGAKLPSSCAHVQMERHPEFHPGLCLHGKSNRRSRVVDVWIFEGPAVDRTRQGAREFSTMRQC